MACTIAMMAFVAVVGPVARVLGLQPWQAGLTVTVSGALWMLLARVWGAASDRHGRRPVLLFGVAGVCVAYAAMCLAIDGPLRLRPGVAWAFLALVLTRGAVGAFYASIPAISQALIADHVPPQRRAGALASLGAASGVGLVLGPAAAAWLSQISLSAPLYGMAVLPLLAWAELLAQAAARAGPCRIRPAADPPGRRAPASADGSGLRGHVLRGHRADHRRLLRARPARPGCARRGPRSRHRADAGRRGAGAVADSGAAPGADAAADDPHRRPGGGRRLRRGRLGRHGLEPVDLLLRLGCRHGLASFPAFSALAANAVDPHEQGTTAGSIGAAQGMGMVAGPLIGTLLYAAGPAVPYLLVAAMLLLMALWPVASPRRSAD